MAVGCLTGAVLAGGCGGGRTHHSGGGGPRGAVSPAGIHKIKHVVVIMQENRSFDSYFGTYPGADGIAGLAGNPGQIPCLPDPTSAKCLKPFHDTGLVNGGGPHGKVAGLADINKGAMNGFVKIGALGL